METLTNFARVAQTQKNDTLRFHFELIGVNNQNFNHFILGRLTALRAFSISLSNNYLKDRERELYVLIGSKKLINKSKRLDHETT